MQGRQDNDKLRLLVIEDEGLWRDMLCLALSAQLGMEVVGMGSSSDDLVSLCKALHPDVLLIGTDLEKDPRAITAARAVKAERTEIGIVVLAASSDCSCLSSLPSPDTPGWSYIIKQSLADVSALVRAIEAAAAGLVVLDPAILAGTIEARYSRLGRLTPRQMDVLHLMAKGYSNNAIARALVLEEKSVENHINAIFSQLVVNRDPSVHPRVKAVVTYLQESREYSARAS
jgi:DNA-binding NarL/FixJ family response regulator